MTTIALTAHGFRLTLHPEATRASVDPARFKGTLRLRSALGESAHEFRASADFPAENLEDLCGLIEQHIGELLHSPPGILQEPVEAATWVPLDLSMQVRLLDGEVERNQGPIGGEFGVLVLLNIGDDPSTGTSVYGGFEGEVDVQEAVEFCSAVRSYIARLRHA